MLISFTFSVPKGIRKKGGKTCWTYQEWPKRIGMMTRKNNEINNERINDGIDYNNGGII